MPGYRNLYVVDGGKARIIPFPGHSWFDHGQHTGLGLSGWVRSRWRIKPKLAVGETKYGTGIGLASNASTNIRACSVGQT
jgi:hypothetical protein